MGRILNCFVENSEEFIELLSKNLNHIVFMLRKREAITTDQELSVQRGPSDYIKIENLFTYIEVNEVVKTFMHVLNQTHNGGITGYIRLADLYYFSTKLKSFQLFQIGTDVVLSCKVENCYDVQWLKSGTELSTNTKFKLKNDGLVHKLIIINAQGDDAGDYVCRCCYDRTECTIKADIKVIEGLKSLEVVNGESLQLTCKLNANVNVKWSRNGQELSRDIHTTNETTEEILFNYTLTIKNVKEEYSGEYSCLYENLKTSCNVIVKEKPIEQIISTGTTKILYEISDTQQKLEKKEEEIITKEVNISEIESEIRTTEQEMTAKEIEMESKMSKLPLESKEATSDDLEKERYLLNKECQKLRQDNEKLRENANIMNSELQLLKEERKKLENRVAVLEKYIDSAGDRHQRAVEDILAAQKNTIAELNEKHEDIKKIIHERGQSKTCTVS